MASKYQKSDSSGEKMIKTIDNGDSKILNYNTVSSVRDHDFKEFVKTFSSFIY